MLVSKSYSSTSDSVNKYDLEERHGLRACFMSHGMKLELSNVRLWQMMKFQKKRGGMDLKCV